MGRDLPSTNVLPPTKPDFVLWARTLSKVVLPAPLAPINAVISEQDVVGLQVEAQ